MHAFNQVLAGIRGGALLSEAEEKIADVVKAVKETGRAGKVTLTLDIRELGKGGALSVTDTLIAKIPQPVRGASVFYATRDGQLVKHDPDQPELPMRAVEVKPTERPAAVEVKPQPKGEAVNV